MADGFINAEACPFVISHEFHLHPERVEEIRDHAGGGFPCHQTVDYDSFDESEDADGIDRDRSKEIHCVGSLILQWADWNGFDGGPAFAARCGMFDPPALPTPDAAGVFDSWDDMIEQMEDR
ncbi:MAG: hypothetical protein V3T08_09330 [Gemmatimonadota bacterium]